MDVTDELLSELQLRELARSFASLIPRNSVVLDESALVHLQQTFQKITSTAGSAKLLLTHGAAAWNSLSAFLELGMLSSDPRLRDFCFASTTWVKVFELFLSKSYNAKPKPLKQVLSTLTKLLLKQPDSFVALSIKNHVINSTIPMICEHGDDFSVKPAFQTLEHFLNKRVIASSDIIDEMSRKYLQTELDVADLPRMASISSTDFPAEFVSLIERFALSIFNWLKYPDLAPIAGRLLRSFFLSCQCRTTETHDAKALVDKPLLWMKPLKDFVNKEPSLLEICENHVLPGLLGLKPRDTIAILNTFPLDEFKEGKTGNYDYVDTQLCLLTLKFCVDQSMSATFFDTRINEMDDPQHIALGFLAHSSSNIRITALSIVTSSASPFSLHILDSLQQIIPYFHAEVNPKVRNEFITLMGKYCSRMARNFSVLCKSYFAGESKPILNSIHHKDCARDIQNEPSTARALLQRQASFSKWYTTYLIEELQPTASYQRHITALKILEVIFQVGTHEDASTKLFDRVFVVDGTLSHHGQFFGSRSIRLLHDLIMDPFDDVRLAASLILRNILRNIRPCDLHKMTYGIEPSKDPRIYRHDAVLHKAYHTYILHVLRLAETNLSLTARADHADGVGRLYSLLHGSCRNLVGGVEWCENGWSILDHILSALEKDTKVALNDIRLAIKVAPLHGKLVALRHIISDPGFYDSPDSTDLNRRAQRNLNNRVFDCCLQIWDVVKGVLCVDSPEGYEVEESDSNDVDVGTKDTLSFCWRALKESSALMSSIIIKTDYDLLDSNSGFHYDDFQKFGSLAFRQLAELRHRGAFSTVSQTFSSCCKRCVQAAQCEDPQIKNSSIARLPKDWYQNVLAIIDENASALTRRSAGIPAIVTGILSAFPSGEFFDHVVVDLQAIADGPVEHSESSDQLRLPQVHALNCLKDIFTDALLGPASEPYIADTLEISAGCLGSQIWAIRNCGLMLFKALVSRLNGGTDTASTRASSSHRRFSRLAYEKYTNLPNLTLKLLYQNNLISINDLHHHELHSLSFSLQAQQVFPALEIVERSGIPEQHFAEIEQAIRYHMEGPVWAIREKAAKAFALMVDEKYIIIEIKKLLDASERSQNVLHGRFLCMRFLVSRIGATTKDEKEVLFLILEGFTHFVTQNACPFTIAAYLDIVADGLELLSRNKEAGASIAVYSTTLKIQLLNKFKDSTGFSRESWALLTKVLKRCIVLIENSARNSSNEGDHEFLKLAQMLQDLDLYKGPVIEQNTIKSIGSTQILSLMDCNTSTTKSINAKSPRRCDQPSQKFDPGKSSHRSRLFLTSDHLMKENHWPNHESPSRSEDQLRLAGDTVALTYSNNPGNSVARGGLTAWICKLFLAGDERSDFTIRLAAADSIERFASKLLKTSSALWSASELLGVYLALYHVLLDDDEEVRDRGAVAASILLSGAASGTNISMLSLMPAAATKKVQQYLIDRYKYSAILWVEAASQLTGAASCFRLRTVETHHLHENSITGQVISFHLLPVRDLLQKARRQNIALFVEEKQNLFVDPVIEARSWARVMLELHSTGINLEMISEFHTWCKDGLKALIEATESQEDGPLGWTTKSEVFALGMRVILATRVQIHGIWKNTRDADISVLVMLLRKLLSLGTKELLNGLWLQQIEEILRDVARDS